MTVTCVNCGREGELVNRDPDRYKHLSKVYCGYCIRWLQRRAGK